MHRSLKIIWVLYLLPFLSFCYAAFEYRHFFNDGAAWIYYTIRYQFFFYDKSYLRIADTLPLEIPALYIKLFQPESIKAAIVLSGLLLLVHPIVSAFFSYKILKHDKNEQLFLFVVLSLITSIIPTHIYAIAGVQMSISFFWPAFFLCISRHVNVFRVIVILALITALTFSHNASIFLVFTLLIISIYRAIKLKHKIFYLVSAISLSSFMLHLITIINNLVFEKDSISYYTNLDFSHYFKISTLLFFAIFLSLVISLIKENLTKWFIVFSYLIIGVVVVYQIYDYYSLYEQWGYIFWRSSKSRLYSAQLTALIAFTCVLYSFYTHNSEIREKFNIFFRNLLCIGLILGFAFDFSQTTAWSKGMKNAFTIVNSTNKPCSVISREHFQSMLATNGVNDWSFAYISMHLNNLRTVNKVVLVNYLNNPQPEESICSNFPYPGTLAIPGRTKVYLDLKNEGYFDFRPLRKGLKLE